MGTPARIGARMAINALDVDHSVMAALVEQQLADAIQALERRDVDAARRAVSTDVRVDALHRKIEVAAIQTLVDGVDNPHEVRALVSAMKVAGDLERVGDLAKNVARRSLVLNEHPLVSASAGVARMGRAALRQISDILNAYSARNLAAAKAVWGGDDDLDELYNSVFEETLVAMMDDSGLVSACTHLVFMAKNFERVGDHATNIAETLHFLVTGVRFDDDRPKGDETSMTDVQMR